MTEVNFDKIISRSFEITKKFKWLWVYGLVLAIFSGTFSSGGGGGGGNFPSFPSKTIDKIPKSTPVDFKNKATEVLGAATNAILDWFHSVPVGIWILIGFLVILIIILGIVIGAIVRAWAKGSLIYGLDQADREEKVTLSSTSPYGVSKIKHLIIFSIISFVIAFGLISVIVLFYAITSFIFSIVPVLMIFWMIIIGILAIFTIILSVIMLSMVTIYAERLIVLFHYSPWDAWKKGLLLGKKNFLHTIVMGILNSALGCGAGCISSLVLLIVFGVPALIFAMLIFIKALQIPLYIPVLGLVVILILYIYANYLFSAWLMVFKFSNWNLLFKEIMKEEAKK
jgi:hypothetical protein